MFYHLLWPAYFCSKQETVIMIEMRFYNRRNFPELVIYVAVWVTVILIPVVTAFWGTLSGNIDVIHWQRIVGFWTEALPFFILFILNNRFLLPYLFFRQRIALYVVSAICPSVSVFFIVGLILRDVDAERFNKFKQGRIEYFQERKKGNIYFYYPETSDKHFWMNENRRGNERPKSMSADRGMHPSDSYEVIALHHFPHPPREGMPLFLPMFRGPFFGRMLIALLMFCFSLAVKLFFKSLRDREAMKELERNKLQTELDYLKYQINPHFFMNTLNNIHALVDINTEKAKQTIVVLSKLMRYVLYESNKRTVSLSKEVEFLQHYVELMRIRYTDNVKIKLSVSDETKDIKIPPLLFVTFVENAFKHGISYRHPSFVSIDLMIENHEIVFHCVNSNFSNSKDQYHGIGLDNVRKRLLLLYGERHIFVIEENTSSFDVRLRIPI